MILQIIQKLFRWTRKGREINRNVDIFLSDAIIILYLGISIGYFCIYIQRVEKSIQFIHLKI